MNMKVVTSLEARAFAEVMVPVLCLLGCMYRALGYLSGIRYGRVKLLLNFDGDPCFLKRGNKLLSGAYPKKTGDYFAHDRKFALFQRYGEKEAYRIFLQAIICINKNGHLKQTAILVNADYLKVDRGQSPANTNISFTKNLTTMVNIEKN